MMISGSQTGSIIYFGVGILIYGFYVIIDMKMIVEKVEIDDYILGAVMLYVDLMTLFIQILQLLGNRK
jgi:FtsH-binding integral membrane protein